MDTLSRDNIAVHVYSVNGAGLSVHQRMLLFVCITMRTVTKLISLIVHKRNSVCLFALTFV